MTSEKFNRFYDKGIRQIEIQELKEEIAADLGYWCAYLDGMYAPERWVKECEEFIARHGGWTPKLADIYNQAADQGSWDS